MQMGRLPRLALIDKMTLSFHTASFRKQTLVQSRFSSQNKQRTKHGVWTLEKAVGTVHSRCHPTFYCSYLWDPG